MQLWWVVGNMLESDLITIDTLRMQNYLVLIVFPSFNCIIPFEQFS